MTKTGRSCIVICAHMRMNLPPPIPQLSMGDLSRMNLPSQTEDESAPLYITCAGMCSSPRRARIRRRRPPGSPPGSSARHRTSSTSRRRQPPTVGGGGLCFVDLVLLLLSVVNLLLQVQLRHSKLPAAESANPMIFEFVTRALGLCCARYGRAVRSLSWRRCRHLLHLLALLSALSLLAACCCACPHFP